MKNSILQLLSQPVATMNEVEIYKTILAEQKATYDTIVFIWIAITAILITGTLFWNFFIANRKIESEVEKKTKELTDSINNLTNEMYKSLETKFADIKNDFTSKLKDLNTQSSNQLKEELDKGLKKNEREFEKIWGDIHRSFKTIAQLDDQLDSAVERCFFAIMHYQKAKNHEKTIGEIIDDLKDILMQPEAIQQIKDNKNFMLDEGIQFAEKFIPDTSGETKHYIISRLKECKQ